MSDKKSNALLISFPDEISVGIADLFLKEGFRVEVFSENLSAWKKVYGRYFKGESLGFLIKEFKEVYEYLVFVESFFYNGIKSKKTEKEILFGKINSFINGENHPNFNKLILVFSAFNYNQEDIDLVTRLLKGISFEIIILPDVYGPNPLANCSGIISTIVKEVIKRKTVFLPRQKIFVSPLSLTTFLDYFKNNLLIKDFLGRTRFITGEKTLLSEIVFDAIGNISSQKLKITDGKSQEILFGGNSEVIESSQSRDWSRFWKVSKAAKKNVFVGVATLSQKEDGVEGKTALRIISSIKRYLSKLYGLIFSKLKYYLAVFVFSAFVAGAPFLILMSGIFLVNLSAKSFLDGNSSFSKNAFDFSGYLFKASSKAFSLYTLDSFALLSDNFSKLVNISDSVAAVLTETEKLGKKISGESEESVRSIVKRVGSHLEVLYRETSFLESDVKDKNLFGVKNVLKVRSKLGNFISFVNYLPSVLGEEGEKLYLLLFQNNMELRPTGGFIGSFALVKFKNGELADINVYDVYDADGQLKGHVEPPGAIKKYLKEANWFLRDSNWSPDYRVSAEKAAWFLEKEMGVEVDGVISVDIDFVKILLDSIGPINIPDYNRLVDSGNLYEVVQYEAEKEFFPGSKKKSNFLTALSKSLIAEVTQGKVNYKLLGKGVYEAVGEKHVQILFNNKTIQDAIDRLGWLWAPPEICLEDNCINDFVGVVEANLGVNKANYFIKRSIKSEIFVEEGIIKKKVVLTLTNSSNPVLGYRGTYRSYVRLFAPKGSQFSDIKVTTKGHEESFLPEIEREDYADSAGVILDVLNSSSAKVVFVVEGVSSLAFDKSGIYRLKFIKQAGTSDDEFGLEINLPRGLLPMGGRLLYTQALVEDFTGQIIW